MRAFLVAILLVMGIESVIGYGAYTTEQMQRACLRDGYDFRSDGSCVLEFKPWPPSTKV